MEGVRRGTKSGRDEWWWCDALFMAPPVLARLALVDQDMAYLRLLDDLWWDASEALYDPAECLFFRDRRYRVTSDTRGSRAPDGRKVFWSRGNGWVLAGLARVLEAMPEHHASRHRYTEMLREMAHAIQGLQQSDGLWRADLKRPAAFPERETSGTALFTYALAWGVRSGALDTDRFLLVIRRAWRGLRESVNAAGRLGSVQPPGGEPGPTSMDDTAPFGVGALLLAGSEILRLARMSRGRSLS